MRCASCNGVIGVGIMGDPPCSCPPPAPTGVVRNGLQPRSDLDRVTACRWQEARATHAAWAVEFLDDRHPAHLDLAAHHQRTAEHLHADLVRSGWA